MERQKSTINKVVLTVNLDMASSKCGYPICCPGDQPKFVTPSFYSSEVMELVPTEDLDKFFTAVSDLMVETGAPLFPLLLQVFCLPFWPPCIFVACARRRRNGMST